MLKPRRHLDRLVPYELPKARPCGDLLRLDQNENFAAASPVALAAARDACAGSARYPDPDASTLREAIAGLHELHPGRIVCARGAMELISLLATAYLEPGATAVGSQFGYMYFRTATELAGARLILAPEPGLVAEPAALAAAVTDSTRLLFVANPGNPTGSHLPKSSLLQLRRELPDSIVLVIDEAYAEFVQDTSRESCFDMADAGATVILRTFSKIYGLAGLRIGWGYFPSEIASLMRVLQQPNGVTAPSQAAAVAAIADQAHVESLRERTIGVRRHFEEVLRARGFDALPSQGNFVLLRFESAAAAANADVHLRADAISTRGMSGYGLPDCLRVTMGTDAEMERVMAVLGRWVDAT